MTINGDDEDDRNNDNDGNCYGNGKRAIRLDEWGKLYTQYSSFARILSINCNLNYTYKGWNDLSIGPK